MRRKFRRQYSIIYHIFTLHYTELRTVNREFQKPALLFLPYLPPIAWFGQLSGDQPVWIEREENFPKSTFRNRCEIATANGRKTLTIPLAGGRDHHQLYKDVQISYHNNWQRIHWNSILSAYGSAPFFEHYSEKFQKFYETRYQFLFDFNLKLLKTVLAILRTDAATLQFTTAYHSNPDNMKDLRNAQRFTISEPNELHYHQIFEDRYGFLANLSIIDLVFNMGPQAGEWVKN